MANTVGIDQLESKLGYSFQKTELLTLALTHSSALDEGQLYSNERLEFLGDSVLSLIISNYLFHRYPNLPEGGMTRIRAGVVSEVSLAEAARRIELWRYLILGKALEMSGGRKQASVLADAYESVIAAIYLDGGMEFASTFVLDALKDHIVRAVRGRSYRDYKTELQEWVQRDGEVSVRYEVENSDGPDHRKTFYICVMVSDRIEGRGCGHSKKEAEQAAAREACEKLIPGFMSAEE